MLREPRVNLGNALLSFSDAVDLANPSISNHQIRTAFVAWQMAVEAGFPEARVRRVFIGSILHDVGALTPEDKTRLHKFARGDVETHCIRGACLYNSCPVLTEAAQMVRWHHRGLKDWDRPIAADEVVDAQILHLADTLERWTNRDVFILHQHAELIEKIRGMARDQIHSDVVDLLLQVARREDFWLDLVSPRLYSTLLNFGPLKQEEIEIDQLFSISAFFKKLIDFKSPFTATHSSGVAACCTVLAKMFGLASKDVSLLELAGYLHDLGKLVIPNAILEKNGKLSQEEFAIMKQHTYFTYTILNSIGGLGPIPEWAAFHHERLDGTGYPFHVGRDRLETGARIMAVADVFTALAEDRPYRPGMKHKEVARILRAMADREILDSRIVTLLLENYDEVLQHVKSRQEAAGEEYRGLMSA